MARGDDRHDRGAVAVVVALVVTLVLIPVAALALDLGSSYTFAAALQRAADAAAEAGAQELARQQRLTPAVTQAVAIQAATTVAIDVLCHDPLLNPGPPDGAGIPQGPWYPVCVSGGRGWASDRDVDPLDPNGHPNGEIEFYTGPPSSSHLFSVGQLVTGGGTGLVDGIRVVTPPATVRYAFAPLFGVSSGAVQRAASAELRTVLPVQGYLPFYTTAAEVAPGRSGAWCARSAPYRSWWLTSTAPPSGAQSVHPAGIACDDSPTTAAPRGYLTGVVPGTPIQPGDQVALAPQVWPDVARLRTLTPMFFGTSGRLTQPGCPGGNGASTGGYPGVESAHLADFADSRIGPADALQNAILAGTAIDPTQQGWLLPSILDCGRLGVLPVVAGVPATGMSTPPPLGTPGPLTVVGLRLVWLDSSFSETDPAPIATASAPGSGCLSRGFYWENPYTAGYCPAQDDIDAPLRAVTGYVLDPTLLPATVTAADATNTTSYLASGLPATVRLARDVGDPPPS
jgi:hypothetical protein